MESFDILNKKQNIWGKHFLEASAGTGKTFTIQHLFVRLLLETKEPLGIDRLLIVTFTRAATRELKIRLRKTLESTIENLKNKEGPGYLQPILEAGEQRIEEMIQRLTDALFLFDQAPIFTIHGFCYHMLQECAFSLKIPFSLQDPEEESLSFLAKEHLAEFLHYRFPRKKIRWSQMEPLLNLCQGNIEDLLDKIHYLTLEEADIMPLESFEDFYSFFLSKQQKYKTFAHLDTFTCLDRLIEAHKITPLTKTEAKEQKQRLLSVLNKENPSEEDFEKLLFEKKGFIPFLKPEFLREKAKLTLTEEEKEFLSFIQDLSSLLLKATDPQRTLLILAREAKIDLESFLKKRNLSTFGMLLKTMGEVLEQGGAKKKIQSFFHAVIVDEFQDTDPLQWNIFNSLFTHQNLLAFYLVGDPKQSIYAFRSADLYTYLQAKNTFGQDHFAYLDTSYRSSKSLLKCLNAFFSSTNWLKLPLISQSLIYHPVKGGHEESPFDNPMEIVFLENPPAAEEIEEKVLFPFLVQEITLLQKEKNIPLSQFAILVKDRYQAQKLQTFLLRNGLYAALKRSSSLIQTRAYSLLKTFLFVLSKPKEIGALKHFLLSEWFDHTPEDLLGKLDNPLMVFSLEKIAHFKDVFHKEGFAAAFSSFLNTCWLQQTSSLLVSFIQNQGKEAFAHLQQLLELLTQEEKNHPSLSQLYTFMVKLQEKEGSEDLLVHQSAEENAVIILTTHLSKGLEFEVVFAIGMAFRSPNPKGYTILREDKKRKICLFNLQDAACIKALEDLDAEKLRQLYVALTRAKKAVYLPFIPPSLDKPLKLGTAAPIELFLSEVFFPNASYQEKYDLISHLSRDRVQELIQKYQKEDIPIGYRIIAEEIPLLKSSLSSSSLSLRVKNRPPLIPYKENILSFSQLQKQTSHSFDLPIQKNSDIPAGVDFGNFFHQVIEEILIRGLHHPFSLEAIKKVISFFISHSPFATYQDRIVSMIENLFNLPLSDKNHLFTLKDIPSSQLLVEMEFLYSEPHHYMKGFTDLIFRYQDTYYLLDWKTNDLDTYHPDRLHQEMQLHNYYLQAELYSKALSKYLNLFSGDLFSSRFGGAFYIFVRGPAFIHFMPERSVYANLP